MIQGLGTVGQESRGETQVNTDLQIWEGQLQTRCSTLPIKMVSPKDYRLVFIAYLECTVNKLNKNRKQK